MAKKTEIFLRDLAEWARSLRFGGYTLVLFGIVVFGGFTLSHSVSVYVAQQQEIRVMRQALADAQKRVEKASKDLQNWQDPEFIKAQARQRLFYVLPGEKQLTVITDVELPATAEETNSAQLTARKQLWSKTLLASLLQAGYERAGADPHPAEADSGPAPADPAPAEAESEAESEAVESAP